MTSCKVRLAAYSAWRACHLWCCRPNTWRLCLKIHWAQVGVMAMAILPQDARRVGTAVVGSCTLEQQSGSRGPSGQIA